MAVEHQAAGEPAVQRLEVARQGLMGLPSLGDWQRAAVGDLGAAGDGVPVNQSYTGKRWVQA